MEEIFKSNLKRLLKERIIGSISVHIYNDTLIVDIYTNNTCGWHYTISNISNQILKGLSSENVAVTIIKRYRQYVINRHFYAKFDK